MQGCLEDGELLQLLNATPGAEQKKEEEIEVQHDDGGDGDGDDGGVHGDGDSVDGGDDDKEDSLEIDDRMRFLFDVLLG